MLAAPADLGHMWVQRTEAIDRAVRREERRQRSKAAEPFVKEGSGESGGNKATGQQQQQQGKVKAAAAAAAAAAQKRPAEDLEEGSHEEGSVNRWVAVQRELQ
jgi:hypothetical protein